MKRSILKKIGDKYYPVIVDVEDEPIIDNRSYEEKIEELIRERYTVNQELAIQRQRDEKPNEFQEYYNYCEQCKMKVKSQL